MGNRYFELRLPSALKSATGIDIANHLQPRQFLGSAVVVCENPFAMLSVVRKAWHKKVRATQNERARTLNAEEILKFTRRIIQMQRLRFTYSHPDDSPCADIYFTTPQDLTVLPSGCYTVYLTCPVTRAQLQAWTAPLLNGALIVNYDVGADVRSLGFRPKSELESQLLTEWSSMMEYLWDRNIRPSQLDMGNEHDPDLNNVLDTLLDSARGFTERAADFQHHLDIAQPLMNIPEQTRERFNVVLRLAHRVQALVPPNPHVKQLFGSTETFFLRDRASESLAISGLALENM